MSPFNIPSTFCRIKYLVGFIFLASNIQTAQGHPHDILARCELTDGTWKMCDDTIHDPETNKHIPKPKDTQTKNADSTESIIANNQRKDSETGSKGIVGTEFNPVCAEGFSKVGQDKFGTGDIEWFVCSTPTITCHSFTLENGLKSFVNPPEAIIQLVNEESDITDSKSFRVQYRCSYEYNYEIPY